MSQFWLSALDLCLSLIYFMLLKAFGSAWGVWFGCSSWRWIQAASVPCWSCSYFWWILHCSSNSFVRPKSFTELYKTIRKNFVSLFTFVSLDIAASGLVSWHKDGVGISINSVFAQILAFPIHCSLPLLCRISFRLTSFADLLFGFSLVWLLTFLGQLVFQSFFLSTTPTFAYSAERIVYSCLS